MQQAGNLQVISRAAARQATARIENPPGEAPLVEPQAPTLAALEVGEVEGGAIGTAEARLRSDGSQVMQRRMIAGEQKMVAVIDLAIQRRFVIGAAATAGMVRGLMQDHIAPAVQQAEASGEFVRGRFALQGQQEGPLDLSLVVGSRLALDSLGEFLGGGNRERRVQKRRTLPDRRAGGRESDTPPVS